MKKIFLVCVVGILQFLSLSIFADTSNEIKRIKTTSFFFQSPSSENMLFFQKADADGFLFRADMFGKVYLKDSYISDDTFQKKCTGKISLQWVTHSDHTPGTFDHYDPFYIRNNSPKFYCTERSMFTFYYHLFFHTPPVFQKAKKGEIFGYKTPLWTQNAWTFIEYEFTHKKRPVFLTEERYSNLYDNTVSSEKSFLNKINSGKFMLVDNKIYNVINQYKKNSNYAQKNYFIEPRDADPWHVFWKKENISHMKKLFEQSSQNIDTPWKCEETNLPIMLIDADHHSQRVDKNDWSVNTYLNSKSGDFFEYFFFDKELDYVWPLYLRDWALDHLAGVHICRKSAVGVILNQKEKVITRSENKLFDPKKILFALDEQNKPWHPDPVPEDKNNIPKDRLHYNGQPGRIFGSYSKVWELDIWQRVGYMLKKHPEGIYLVGYGTLLQAEETQSVEEEHAFIQKHGVLITPELYTALEYLRQSQKEKSY